MIAKTHPRLRMHYNIHDNHDEPCQRLLIAMEPDSYIRPHMHLIDPKPESFIAIRGKFALVVFENNGKIKQIVAFGTDYGTAGIDIPPGIWHTVVALKKGAILFETKPGPFKEITKKDMALWAPDENSSRAKEYLNELVDTIKLVLRKGDKYEKKESAL